MYVYVLIVLAPEVNTSCVTTPARLHNKIWCVLCYCVIHSIFSLNNQTNREEVRSFGMQDID